MDKKKPIGKILSGRFFAFFTAVLLFVFFYTGYVSRELWFDEVLTLFSFASLDSPLEIYRNYTIPNNQIIHSVLLHWLLQFGISPEMMRIIPLFCGLITIYLLYRTFARECGRYQLGIAITALVISPPFMLYASALRGYMLAAMFCTAGMCAARSYALGGRKIKLLLWFLFSMLAAGVMPSALAGIAGAGLYIVPHCGKYFLKSKRLYMLAVAPLAAFALFYMPIWEKLLSAFELKEGWHSGGYALAALGIALLTTFLPLWVAAMIFHRPCLRFWPRTLIWLLPAGGLLLPVYPFPRVWFVLFPVFTLLAAGYLRRMPQKYLKYCFAAVLICGSVTSLPRIRETLSPWCSLAGQDDFYAPRFMRESFRPFDMANHTAETFGNSRMIFITFDADPYALMYSFGRSGYSYPQQIRIDVPYNSVKELPDRALMISAAEEDTKFYTERFNGKFHKIYCNESHILWLFERD